MADTPSLTSSDGVMKSDFAQVHGPSSEGNPEISSGPRHEEVHMLLPHRGDNGLDGLSVSRFVPPTYDEALLGIKTKIARQEEVLRRHHVPRHWKPPGHRIGKIAFNALCLMSFGHAGLDSVWAAIMLWEEGDESAWAEGIQQTLDRLTNINVVASLLLSTCAAFITTPPPNPAMVNYTLRGPYLCILGSFALLIGGIIVCSASLLVTGKARPYWAKEVLYANRFHVYCTLAMLSYPFVSIGIATLLLAFGLLSAVWSAQDRGSACVIVLILPISMAVLFGVSNATAKAKSRLRERESNA
ncbi:hypothetical protein BT96DRAFT_1021485 [Gymnopus androsaceus JB14]|uniref:Transmembrane protein n=1 Tax=Gymnopus androsaceus JB14 TaxID=1447944 RepID=A0A6A4HGG7_9AGAR|nr:hypothetical protein BT96DRAFT_1021485 [Gymnopus androsaceus JB14]